MAELLRALARAPSRPVRAIAVLSGFAVIASTLGIVAWSQQSHVKQQEDETHRRLATTYLEQGQALVVDGHPMQALPYFVAANAEGSDRHELPLLVSQASRTMPRVILV